MPGKSPALADVPMLPRHVGLLQALSIVAVFVVMLGAAVAIGIAIGVDACRAGGL